MRAILINPHDKSITEVDYDGRIEHMYELIGCSLVTAVTVYREEDGSQETLWLDDEGLFVNDQKFFMWAEYPQPLAGRGLVLGTSPEGDSIATKLDISKIEPHITWPNLRYTHMTTSEKAGDVFGHSGFIITNVPHFEVVGDAETKPVE